ncbi:SAND domain-containing protein [Caenorhabditis elegans]|uniref:SAND domain-containing protein n=1 Tax=Caenorhabditis elegans TaxID=6239 RepID=O17208_CAEEL|nr:SAND domain-containing protein [Caenorhabditis elegans]CCD61132.1 SAND domain-containing protein [Caenorhabditis elegans]|eukprot:NP_493634.4 GMEB (Glucocorticoid Modulatory Element Binding protein) transcriptional regulator homolog [Caenorhabditis elegans]
MKRILSDGVNEPKLCKFIKEESPHKVKQEPYDDEDLVHLGSESIPSPTSSTSPPFPTEPAVQTIKLPKYMELKCGALVARLHTELFICPGIREKCIEVLDCPGELLTPVEFTIKAEKSKQKDWKGAIKHNGRMLRTLMEFKQLDFYNHHEMCSFKCHSRNYITKNGGSVPKLPPKNVQRRHSSASTTSNVSQTAINQLLQGELIKNPNFLAAFAAHCTAENQKRQEEAERKLQEKQNAIKCLMETDSVTFWNQTIQSKTSTVVLDRISMELGSLAQNLISGRDFAASSSKIIQVLQVLGLSDTVSREMCGQFILPSSVSTNVDGQSSLDAQLPVQHLPSKEMKAVDPIEKSPNDNNNETLSSSEKLELMIRNAL